MSQNSPKVALLSTTLRDGRQNVLDRAEVIPRLGTEKAAMRDYALAASDFGVKYIDAGFAGVEGQHIKVRGVAEAFHDRMQTCILGFCRGTEGDIARSIEAVKPAANSGIAVLVSLAPSHMPKYQNLLRDMPTGRHASYMEDHFRRILSGVVTKRDRGETGKIFVYVEAATQMQREHRARVAKLLIDTGVDIISMPDTMGVVDDPEDYADLFSHLREDLGKDASRVLWSAHCHRDRNVAEAATIIAAKRGLVDIVEGTFGGAGPGEGPGNADLNIVAASLERQGIVEIQAGGMYALNQLAAKVLRRKIPDMAPIVGVKAKRVTGAGIHQDGVQKAGTDHMYTHDFSRFGVPSAQLRMCITPLSGKAGVQEVLREVGVVLATPVELDDVTKMLLRVTANLRYGLSPFEPQDKRLLQSIAWDIQHPEGNRACKLVDLSSIEDQQSSLVKVQLDYDGRTIEKNMTGTGTFSGFMSAISAFLQEEFHSRIDIVHWEECAETDEELGEKRDAVVQATVSVKIGNCEYSSVGFHRNADEAGCKAIMLAVNQWIATQKS